MSPWYQVSVSQYPPLKEPGLLTQACPPCGVRTSPRMAQQTTMVTNPTTHKANQELGSDTNKFFCWEKWDTRAVTRIRRRAAGDILRRSSWHFSCAVVTWNTNVYRKYVLVKSQGISCENLLSKFETILETFYTLFLKKKKTLFLVVICC